MVDSKKIAIVFGTRPEIVKLAPIFHFFKNHSLFTPILIHTGQHKELACNTLMDLLDVECSYFLDLMTQDQTLAGFTSKAIDSLDKILKKIEPCCVLVQGDTSTAFAGALSAFYLKVPVGHVEAGLRTENRFSPFPEEMHRRLIAPLTDLHFSPTEKATQRLLAEGICQKKIYQVGNTVVDSLLTIQKKCQQKMTTSPRPFLLMTAHRRENFGDGLRNICSAIKKIAHSYPDIDIVYPMHLNPNIRSTVHEECSRVPNIKLLPPLHYVDFIKLLQGCHFVLTDSGGVQEEAPILGKPVLVLRESTERMEGVHAGVAALVGTDPESIFSWASKLLEDKEFYSAMAKPSLVYGDGSSGKKIGMILEQYL